MQGIRSRGNLQNLIPIAVVVVGGCEPCAEKMVTQALAQGSSWQDVDETLRILTDMQSGSASSMRLYRKSSPEWRSRSQRVGGHWSRLSRRIP